MKVLAFFGQKKVRIYPLDGHTTMTWLTVPELPLARSGNSAILTQLFSPHGSC
jgi:hypothetical protein